MMQPVNTPTTALTMKLMEQKMMLYLLEIEDHQLILETM
jgi:hypothetical protein